jgi:hypothetical protein
MNGAEAGQRRRVPITQLRGSMCGRRYQPAWAGPQSAPLREGVRVEASISCLPQLATIPVLRIMHMRINSYADPGIS